MINTRIFFNKNVSPRFCYVATFLCSATVLFLRSSRTYLHPVAGWEDATQGINYYTSTNPTILHFYAGYVSLLPNVLDWISVKLLPLQAVPFAQGYFSLGAAACIAPALTAFFINTVQWRPLKAATAAVLITCLPWGDVAAISNTEFSIWSLLAILIITSLNPIEPTVLGVARCVVWRLAIVASSPVAVVCAPTWCYQAWRKRHSASEITPYFILLFGDLSYLCFGISYAHNSAVRPHHLLEGLNAALKLATKKSLLALLVRDIFRVNLGAVESLAAAVVLVGLTLVVWIVIQKNVRRNKSARVAVMFLYISIAEVCLASGLGRGVENGADFVLSSPRYHYVPQILWLTVLALVLDTGIHSLSRLRVPVFILVSICMCLIWEKGLKSYTSNDYKEFFKSTSLFLPLQTLNVN